jgi:hypothetical protein
MLAAGLTLSIDPGTRSRSDGLKEMLPYLPAWLPHPVDGEKLNVLGENVAISSKARSEKISVLAASLRRPALRLCAVFEQLGIVLVLGQRPRC